MGPEEEEEEKPALTMKIFSIPKMELESEKTGKKN